jgi:hypothetical protein
MQYPGPLAPTTVEPVTLPSGRVVQVPATTPVYAPWSGEPVEDTYGGKLVLDFDGRPAFAELAILWTLQSDGWSGVWVDTYRRKCRTSYWPKDEVRLPLEQQQLLDRIYARAGSRRGCWDVFCWRGQSLAAFRRGAEYLFAESKWHGHDRIRDTQRQWLAGALECGLPLTSFLIVEWSVRAEPPCPRRE